MSDQYIVSARKYRPRRFDEVVGQEATTTTLKNAIRNRQIAHSFLFCGSRGVGKTTIARILAKTINCKDLQTDGEACDQCDSCTSFNKNASFNIHELDAASKNSVDDIRSLIEQVNYAPQNAEFKVFIIDEVHMLTTQAFNAFLKTLEEPPSYAKFIMATTEKHKVLPTILSRCQIYDFNRIKVADIQGHLKKIAATESIEAEDNALNMIAQKADGGLRDALSMYDRLVSIHGNKLQYSDVLQNLNILDHDYYFQIIESILKEESDTILLKLQEIISRGFDIEIFLSGLSEHIRNLWVARRDNTLILIETAEDIKLLYQSQASKMDEPLMLNLLQIIADTEVGLKTARNKRLLSELALLKMCYVKRLMSASWMDTDEKKKLAKTSSKQILASSKADVKSDSLASNTQPLQNKAIKGIGIEDLIKSATKQRQNDKELISGDFDPEIGIYTDAFWKRLITDFDGLKHQKSKLQELTPTYSDEKILFYTGNSIEKGIIEGILTELVRIAKAKYERILSFECIIDENLSYKEDTDLKEEFEKLLVQYPILEAVKDNFKIRF